MWYFVKIREKRDIFVVRKRKRTRFKTGIKWLSVKSKRYSICYLQLIKLVRDSHKLQMPLLITFDSTQVKTNNNKNTMQFSRVNTLNIHNAAYFQSICLNKFQMHKYVPIFTQTHTQSRNCKAINCNNPKYHVNIEDTLTAINHHSSWNWVEPSGLTAQCKAIIMLINCFGCVQF